VWSVIGFLFPVSKRCGAKFACTCLFPQQVGRSYAAGEGEFNVKYKETDNVWSLRDNEKEGRHITYSMCTDLRR